VRTTTCKIEDPSDMRKRFKSWTKLQLDPAFRRKTSLFVFFDAILDFLLPVNDVIELASRKPKKK